MSACLEIIHVSWCHVWGKHSTFIFLKTIDWGICLDDSYSLLFWVPTGRPLFIGFLNFLSPNKRKLGSSIRQKEKQGTSPITNGCQNNTNLICVIRHSLFLVMQIKGDVKIITKQDYFFFFFLRFILAWFPNINVWGSIKFAIYHM